MIAQEQPGLVAAFQRKLSRGRPHDTAAPAEWPRRVTYLPRWPCRRLYSAEERAGGQMVMGEFMYRHAARFIAGAVVAAFACYAVGVWKADYQAAAFKGSELLVWGAGLFSVLLIRRQLHAQEVQQRDNEHQRIQLLKQQAEDHRWRTYAFYHEHFSDVPPDSCLQAVYQIAQDHGFIGCFQNRGQPLPANVLQRIVDEKDLWEKVRPYLDHFEVFCGAINANLVNEEYAYSLQATRVVRNYTVFRSFIEHDQRGAPSAYVELVKVARRWRDRMDQTDRDNQSRLGIGGLNGARAIQGPNVVPLAAANDITR